MVANDLEQKHWTNKKMMRKVTNENKITAYTKKWVCKYKDEHRQGVEKAQYVHYLYTKIIHFI